MLVSGFMSANSARLCSNQNLETAASIACTPRYRAHLFRNMAKAVVAAAAEQAWSNPSDCLCHSDKGSTARPNYLMQFGKACYTEIHAMLFAACTVVSTMRMSRSADLDGP